MYIHIYMYFNNFLTLGYYSVKKKKSKTLPCLSCFVRKHFGLQQYYPRQLLQSYNFEMLYSNIWRCW